MDSLPKTVWQKLVMSSLPKTAKQQAVKGLFAGQERTAEVEEGRWQEGAREHHQSHRKEPARQRELVETSKGNAWYS